LREIHQEKATGREKAKAIASAPNLNCNMPMTIGGFERVE